MKINYMQPLITLCLLTIATTGIICAQDTQDRSITSKAFDSKRPVRSGKGRVTSNAKSMSYKYVRSDRNVVHRNPIHKKPTTPEALKAITRIGVTMWRGREPVANETGYYLTLTDDNGKKKQLLAERVGIDTVFKPQDLLRFAVESSESGYLYVIGRETYSDDTFGPPYAIFPQLPSDNNMVGPGILFDFPDQRDDPPFLLIDPKKPKYSGELMTIIVSRKPLNIMKVDSDNHLRDSDDLTDLEFGADVEVYSRTDNDDKIYSDVESKSACGSKAREETKRELVLKKTAGRPCGTTSGQLYNDDPHPQTMYHVKVTPGQPAVAFIKLTVH